MNKNNPQKFASGIDFSKIRLPRPSNRLQTTDYGKAALDCFEFGFKTVPIEPGTKKTAVKWDPWLDVLSIEKIAAYWSKHPDHEVGI
ncbi:MAG: hypothetical protein J0653_04585, partial [Deltaproteobacteria bacterium]|nr:hypothetical protein [Deltaproteobacteria bacterium]